MWKVCARMAGFSAIAHCSLAKFRRSPRAPSKSSVTVARAMISEEVDIPLLLYRRSKGSIRPRNTALQANGQFERNEALESGCYHSTYSYY